jgi:hypothetical protein
MNGRPVRALLGLLAAAIGACATVTATRDLNAEFATAYARSLTLEQALAEHYDPATQAALEQAQAQLGAIADRALAAAHGADADATKAAFFALAARAAWKSGPVQAANVLELLAEGRELCASLHDPAAQPARDCAFIAIAGALALADAYADRTHAIAAHESGGRFPASDLNTMREVRAGLEQQFRALDAAQPGIFAAPVSTQFRDYFVEQQFRVYCNARTVRSWMMDLDDDSGDALAGEVEPAEQQMRNVLASAPYAHVQVTIGGQSKVKSCP